MGVQVERHDASRLQLLLQLLVELLRPQRERGASFRRYRPRVSGTHPCRSRRLSSILRLVESDELEAAGKVTMLTFSEGFVPNMSAASFTTSGSISIGVDLHALGSVCCSELRCRRRRPT